MIKFRRANIAIQVKVKFRNKIHQDIQDPIKIKQ